MSACVHQGAPSVGVAKLQASLVFGVSKPKSAAPPVVPDQPIAETAVTGGFDFTQAVGSSLPPIVTAPSTCPTASVTAAPAVPTEAFITGPAREGLYKWKRGGTFHPASGGQLAFGGFENRVVRNFKQVDANTSTFETIQSRLDAPGYSVETFQVKTNGQTVTAGGNAAGIPIVRTGDPERGVVLKEIKNFSIDGSQQGTFTPGTGLLLLPLPVVTGDSYRSVATDAKDGRTIVIDANVTRRQRIDACGDLVDGWDVTSQLTDSANNATKTYEYIVATQYGGVLISEHLSPASTSGTAPTTLPGFQDDLSFQLAQLNPSPLPAGSAF